MNANSNNILDEKLLTLLDDFGTFTLVVPCDSHIYHL
jgi:hypothetical protein